MREAELIHATLLPRGSAVNRHHAALPDGLYDPCVIRRKIDFDGLASRVVEAYNARVRDEPGLSRREVERRAGVQPGTFRKWENGERGKNISSSALRGLAVALKVNEDWLGWNVGSRDVDAGKVTLEGRFLERYPDLDDEQRTIVHAIYERNPGANIAQVAALIQADTVVKDLERRVRSRASATKAKPSRAPKSARKVPVADK